MQIVDDAGNPVKATRTPVSLLPCARGANLLKGYWNNGEATAALLSRNG